MGKSQLHPSRGHSRKNAPNPGSSGITFGRQCCCGKNTAQGIGGPRLVDLCTQGPGMGVSASLSYICLLHGAWHGALHGAGCQQLFFWVE